MALASLIEAVEPPICQPAAPPPAAASVECFAGLRRPFRSFDGSQLSSIVAGQGSRPVLFFGAPGLPAELNAGWISGLAETATVALVETRGLFGAGAGAITELSAEAQTDDAATLIRDLGWARADVVGVCGGAALALTFAARHAWAVASLSLWFGDYELGQLAPKSEHQQNLKAVMELVADGTAPAADVLATLASVMQRSADPEMAPFYLYPFAEPGLFERYCRMNSGVMSIDCGAAAGHVRAPALVGYSAADATAHPDGSRQIARALAADVIELADVSHMAGVRGRAADVASVVAFQSRKGLRGGDTGQPSCA